MTKKRRRLRVDRLLIVFFVFTVILSSMVFGGYKLAELFVDTVSATSLPEEREENAKLEEDTILESEDEATEPDKPVQEEPIENYDEDLVFYEGKWYRKVYVGVVEKTGYCDCEICQGPYVGQVALGGPPKSGLSMAVDPDYIPLGSLCLVSGMVRLADDTGSAIIGLHVDLYCDSHEECFGELYNGYDDLWILEEVEI